MEENINIGELLNITEIKTQYPSLKHWADHCAFELYKKIQEHQLVTEFLHTVGPDMTASQLATQLGPTIGRVNFQKKDNRVVRILYTFEEELKDNLVKVNEHFNKFGWYPSYIVKDRANSGKYSEKVSSFLDFKNITVVYEAKYDIEQTLPTEYLYHFTPDLKWPKIKAMGLTPKTQSKIANHPERIYLLTRIDNLENFGVDIPDLAFSFLNSYEYKDEVKEMYLLKIDVSKLKDMHFFEDPNFYMGEAVWTYQNIPPFAITVYDKIDIKY